MSVDPAQLERLAPLGPRRLTVLFDVANQCNLRCLFCHFSYESVHRRPSLFMPPELFERLAAELLPNAHTAYLSASSESLTHPRFLEILAIAGRHAVPTTRLLTNGQLLRPAVIDGLIEHGLGELHVSIDGATAPTYERIRRGGSFPRLLDNLRALDARKRSLRSRTPLLQFNVTLMRSNLDELEGFVDLAVELGARRIACRLLMPYEGLGMEPELSSLEPVRANERFLAFLEHATRREIAVTSFPDFYPVDGRSWEPPCGPPPRSAGPPIGHIDLPAEPCARARGSLLLAGWALAPGGLERIELRRREASPDGERSVLLGLAKRSTATRPDVTELHRDLPHAWRAGWSFELSEGDLPANALPACDIEAIAVDRGGRESRIGARRIDFDSQPSRTPHLYCRKPFDNLYVDSSAKVYPYPDCQTVDPFGDFAAGGSLRSIWYGEAFVELRRRIVERDAPAMCRTCPDFINRNVADASFFRAREVEAALRRPQGVLDARAELVETHAREIVLTGWATGFSPVVRIDLLSESLVEDAGPAGRPDGLRLLGSAEPCTLERPDVARAYPQLPGRERAGWQFRLSREGFPAGRAVQVRAVAVNADGWDHVLGECRLRFLDPPRSAP